MQYVSPICNACELLRVGGDDLFDVKPACDAFPEGIPDPIWLDGFDHRQAYRGDGGVRFVLAAEPGSQQRLEHYEQTRSISSA